MKTRLCGRLPVRCRIWSWVLATILLSSGLTYGHAVVINEFMAQNTRTLSDEAHDYGDWIELYNSGAQVEDVGGLFLTDDLHRPDQWQIPANRPDLTTLEPSGFLLIWADGQTARGPLHASFKLQASGEAIGLFARDGVTRLDSVTFGAQNADQSYARIPDGGYSWQVAAQPTPGSSNQGRRPLVVINEIMFHPLQAVNKPEELAAEYVELYNAGSEAVDLSGWRMDRSLSLTFPSGTLLPSGGYLVVAADPAIFATTHPSAGVVLGGWQGKLGNSGDTIELLDRNGALIDRVTYFDEGDWAVRELGPVDHGHRGWQWSDQTDGGGRSLELINPALPRNVGQNWAASTVAGGTPGLANSVAAGDVAPFILDVLHLPIIPGPVDSVTVTARLMDEKATGLSAVLAYRVDGQTAFTRVAMVDDGAHGDEASGDGIYGGTIPAEPNNAIVEFYVEARDAGGKVRTWPAPSRVDGASQQGTNVLYQVDGTFDPDAPWVAGSQPRYYLIMTEKERTELALIGSKSNGEEDSDATMNGTFISLDGMGIDVRYAVGIRNRGHGTRSGPPNNFHVHLSHDRTWKGLSSFNFNCRYTYVQIIGSAIHRLSGFAAADALPVQARINGANLATGSSMYGVYVGLEAFDDQWAKKHFPEDSAGNLYTCFRLDSGAAEAELKYEGNNPDIYRNRYFKANNTSQDDWSDLINLFNILNNAPDATYFEEVSKVLNVSQWLHYIALDSCFLNYETGLNRGIGDDYFMYRGAVDTRFVLVPHDLDTILDQGSEHGSITHSIFSIVTGPTSSGVDGLKRFLGRPEIIPLYYQAMLDVTRDVFNPDRLDPLFDQVLGGFLTKARIDAMKQFVRNRRAAVLAQVPRTMTITTDLVVVDGYPWNVSATMRSISGTADAVRTRSVLVSGQPAVWTPLGGKWSASGIPLRPGINRILVQAFASTDAAGDPLQEGFLDVWYDNDHPSKLSGTLSANKTLDAASGPWHITGNLIVPPGVTLTVEPGTTLFFEPGAGLTVNGRCVAVGTAYERIRLTSQPGGGSWAGCVFANTQEDNQLSYVDMEYGDSGTCAVRLDRARVTMDHVGWGHHSKGYVIADDASLTLSHSTLPDLANADLVQVSGLGSSGLALFEANRFGTTTGSHAIVSASGGKRPGPIARFIDNTFTAGTEECIRLAGADAHLEGNVFMHVRRDAGREKGASAVVAGAQSGRVSDVTVVRNLFYDVDRALNCRDGGFVTAVNNTIVQAAVSCVCLYEAGAGGQGAGFYGDGNIFHDVTQVFENPDWTGHPASVTLNRSMLPPAEANDVVWAGTGNLFGDPQLVNTSQVTDPRIDFALRPPSAAIGTGPNGRDMGGLVPAGASVSGEPAPITWRSSATLAVGGPDIRAYKYRLNSGTWSQEILRPEPVLPGSPAPALAPIALSGLGRGTYAVSVLAKDSAGVWQSETAATVSLPWTVDPSYSCLRINEVLALNRSSLDHEGTRPDWIEISYDGPARLDLSGMKITDDPNGPNGFVFPAGTTISAGQFLVLFADSASATSGLHMGFALNHEGDSLHLFDRSGRLLDSVQFGLQLADLSIARMGGAATWALAEPTPGAENRAAQPGNPAGLRINEWLCHGEVLFADDFIELYNPDPHPVSLAGMTLADHPVTETPTASIPSLTFIAGSGYATFVADGQRDSGHVNFRLSADCGTIGLYDERLDAIDKVFYGPQTTDVSQGRVPDGSNAIDFLVLPTPGVINPPPAKIVTATSVLVPENADKRVLVPTVAISDDWRGGKAFDDSKWTLCSGGPGGVGFDTATDYLAAITLDVKSLMSGTGKNSTCYIRSLFRVDAETLAGLTRLTLNLRCDDGFVAYLNGEEVGRKGFAGTPAWNSRAASSVEAKITGWDASIDLSAFRDRLNVGANILAIHAMNSSSSSSDFLISADLEAEVTKVETPFLFQEGLDLLNGLRVMELMYAAAEGSDLDFIELQNVGSLDLDLAGARFTQGIDFVFPQMTLGPGEFVVVAGNQSAFVAKYGTTVPIAGQYSGKLNDEGEQIILTLPSPLEAAILRFTYGGTWYPSAHGGGSSLNVSDPLAAPASWSYSWNWQAAASSPGSR